MNADQVSAGADYEALIQFMYLAPVGLVQIDTSGAILMLNPISAQLLMPLAPHGLLNNLYTALENVAPDLRHRCASYPHATGRICDGVRIALDPAEESGAGRRPRPTVLSLDIVKLDQERLMVVLADVSEQVRREQELRQADALLGTLLTGATDYALLPLDREGRVRGWNAGVQRVTGFDAAAVMGRPFTMFSAADDAALHADDRLRGADAEGWQMEEGWHARADGSQLWGSCLIAPLPEREDDPAGHAYCMVLRDISDRRESGAQLRNAAYTDFLTGAANRRAFFEGLEREHARAQRGERPLSIVVFDADHFKAVNDLHGHPAGDAALRHIAVQLRSAFRQGDVVARIGGEEFAVLLPATRPEEALAMARRACEKVAAAPLELGSATLALTLSAGVAGGLPACQGADELYRRADQALYQAKRQGRNRAESWATARLAAAVQEARADAF